MSKIELILALLLFLLILFSMNMIFANSFSNNVETTSNKGLKNNNKISGNMIYSGSGFLDETSHYPKGDDQPLFFGFTQK